MVEFEKSVFIKRSPQDVFDVITNPAQSTRWQSFVDSAEWTSSERSGVGSTFQSAGRFLGRNLQTQYQVTAWEPPRQVSFKTIQGPIPIEVTNRIEPQDGGTLLTLTGRVEFGGFFKIAEGLAAKQMEKQLDADNHTLKLLMESNQL